MCQDTNKLPEIDLLLWVVSATKQHDSVCKFGGKVYEALTYLHVMNVHYMHIVAKFA